MITVKIKSDVSKREVTTKAGKEMQIFSQQAELETPHMRVPVDVDLQNPNQPYAVGALLVWDIESDLRVGKYGIELGRMRALTVKTK